MRDDAFGDWLPDQFYGLHVRPDLKVGQIATNTHTLFAGTLRGEDPFQRQRGHAAFHMKLMTPWWRLVTL